MNTRTKIMFALTVAIVLGQNYESQVSHLTDAQIAAWSLHDWVGGLLNVALAGMLAAKAFLTDTNSNPPQK